MSRFTYLVTVEVEDDLGMATEYYGEEYLDNCYVEHDDEGNVTLALLDPQEKADIIMAERLGHEEELGIGDYSLDWVSND